MTDAELERVLANCGCGRNHLTEDVGECDVPALAAEVKRLREAVVQERAACAKTAEAYGDQHDHQDQVPELPALTAMAIAAAIRARGTSKESD